MRSTPRARHPGPAAAARRAAFLVALSCLTAPLSGQSPGGSSGSIGADARLGVRLLADALAAPARWTPREWLYIPTSVAALALVSAVDDDLQDFARTHQGRRAGSYFDALEPFGEIYSIAAVLGVYAGGVLLSRPAWRRTGVEAAAASIVAGGIVTPALKALFGRSRPREGEGPYAFDPFSGSYSFPSGHTTQAFAVASVVAAESESALVDVLVYGIAASVGAARIYHDAHFLTDVLAGAAIGTVVGRSMARQGRGLALEVAPGVEGGVSLGGRMVFPGGGLRRP